MDELLYLSDVIRKYRGKVNDDVLNKIVKKYDDQYNPVIKRNPGRKVELEKKLILEIDAALEKLLLN